MDKQTIAQVQRLLESLGHSPGEIDGIWGPKSQAALDAALDAFAPDSKTDFWDEIEDFDREEFRCKCGGKYCSGFQHEPQEAMVRIAQKVRKHFNTPVRVISGLRCPTWNKLQGGETNSQHIYGEAADIWISGVPWEKGLAYIQSLPEVRFAYHIPNSSNIHFDIPKGQR